jgi:hypothetical protein
MNTVLYPFSIFHSPSSILQSATVLCSSPPVCTFVPVCSRPHPSKYCFSRTKLRLSSFGRCAFLLNRPLLFSQCHSLNSRLSHNAISSSDWIQLPKTLFSIQITLFSKWSTSTMSPSILQHLLAASSSSNSAQTSL